MCESLFSQVLRGVYYLYGYRNILDVFRKDFVYNKLFLQYIIIYHYSLYEILRFAEVVIPFGAIVFCECFGFSRLL